MTTKKSIDFKVIKERNQLTCPDCKTQMDKGYVPISLDGFILGAFDGLICQMCGFGLLSEKGYIDSEKIKKEIGKITKFLKPDMNGELHWTESNTVLTSNENIKVAKYGEDKFESVSFTDDEKFYSSDYQIAPGTIL